MALTSTAITEEYSQVAHAAQVQADHVVAQARTDLRADTNSNPDIICNALQLLMFLW